MTTCLENLESLEMSGNLKHVREMSGMLSTVREKILSWKSVQKLFITRWIFALHHLSHPYSRSPGCCVPKH